MAFIVSGFCIQVMALPLGPCGAYSLPGLCWLMRVGEKRSKSPATLQLFLEDLQCQGPDDLHLSQGAAATTALSMGVKVNQRIYGKHQPPAMCFTKQEIIFSSSNPVFLQYP